MEALAREQNWNESRCERLLNALAAIKMLTKESRGENYGKISVIVLYT